MSEQSTLEERLTRSLDQQATGLHDAPFTLDDVRGRARGIQHRRRGVVAGAAAAVEGLIGPGAGATRVVISHDVAHGLAEADLVLGLRGGRQALLAARSEIDEAAVRELYG